MEIVVDGYCIGNPSTDWGYRAIDLETGEVLFENRPGGLATNNIAEYVGCVHALAWCKNSCILDFKIWSDSSTAISWVKKRESNSGIKHPLLERADKWVKSNGGVIQKWDTKSRGEIPADFGHKNKK